LSTPRTKSNIAAKPSIKPPRSPPTNGIFLARPDTLLASPLTILLESSDNPATKLPVFAAAFPIIVRPASTALYAPTAIAAAAGIAVKGSVKVSLIAPTPAFFNAESLSPKVSFLPSSSSSLAFSTNSAEYFDPKPNFSETLPKATPVRPTLFCISFSISNSPFSKFFVSLATLFACIAAAYLLSSIFNPN